MKKLLTFVIILIFANLNSQNVFEDNIIGTWKIKQKLNNDTSIIFGEYLRFLNNEILFLKMEGDKEIIETVIKIEFVDELDNLNKRFSGQLVKFPNGEIWELQFRDINNETRLIWKQKKTREGGYLFQIDDRGIIIDSEKRKKAFEGEINTYYVKLK